MDPVVKELLKELPKLFLSYAVPLFYRLIGAIILWTIGRFGIRAIKRGALHNLRRREFDPTISRYIESVLAGALTVLLVLSILGIFGVDTTSFAAMLAAAGIAIGTAWSGLLANFAAGVFLVVLHPFRVGQTISAAGVTGTVAEIGLFATSLDTGDNVRVFIGNNKLFSDVIHNYSSNRYRRVDLKAHLPHDVNPREAIDLLRAEVAKIPHVLEEPAPIVELAELALTGPVLAVRPCCHHDYYGDVLFATNDAIQRTFARAGYSAPGVHQTVRTATT